METFAFRQFMENTERERKGEAETSLTSPADDYRGSSLTKLIRRGNGPANKADTDDQIPY